MLQASKTEKTSGVTLLHGKRNNFEEYKASLASAMTIKYGYLANVIKTGVAYVVPPVTEDQWLPPPVGADAVALTAADRQKLRINAETKRNETVHDLRSKWPAMFADMMLTLSADSEQEVRNHAGFEAADLELNPNALWHIIRNTHLSTMGGIAALGELEKDAIETEFSSLRQTATESIGDYKRRFDILVRRRRAATLPDMTEPALAARFLNRLDPTRHGAMVAYLTNTRDIPDTLADAWVIASTWKVSAGRSTSAAAMSSVFMTADEMTSSHKKPDKPRGADNLKAGGGTVPPTAHAAADGGGKQGGKKNKRVRRCLNCGETGHPYFRCDIPLKPELAARKAQWEAEHPAVMVAIGEDDPDDADGHDSVVFMTTDKVLFSATDVLLDNQGGIDIFGNPGLLQDLRATTKPLSVSGIDSTASPIVVNAVGRFGDFGDSIRYSASASANILSQARLQDEGYSIALADDEYTVTSPAGSTLVFSRQLMDDGTRSRHYSCRVLTTVAENMQQYTKAEVKSAIEARRLLANLGSPASAAAADAVSRMTNTTVTAQDVRRADAIFGRDKAGVIGSNVKRASVPARVELVPRQVQVQQYLEIDIMFVKQEPFLVGVMMPLHLILAHHLRSRAAKDVYPALSSMVNEVRGRSFDIQTIRTDGEKAVAKITPALLEQGIVVDLAGPGQHCPHVERAIRTVKNKVRGYDNTLPFVMCRAILIYCVLFCVSRANMVASAGSHSPLSPRELFTGRRIDAKIDLAHNFGDYVLATPPVTDNTMQSRAEGCLMLLPTGNLIGSAKVYRLRTDTVVTRDQLAAQPMPDVLIEHLNALAAQDGIARGGLDIPGDPPTLESTDARPLPSHMPLGGVLPADSAVVPEAGVHQDDHGGYDDDAYNDNNEAARAAEAPEKMHHADGNNEDWTRGHLQAAASAQVDGSSQSSAATERDAGHNKARARRHGPATDSLQSLPAPPQVLKISVKRALRERGAEATAVIEKELQQMLNLKVWHGVHVRTLSQPQRSAIIRSTMFLRDKFTASGAWEKFKARLVARGDGQDKTLYDDISSPTAATISVLSIAAIAANEGRQVMVLDVGGAFLECDISPTGVVVHMALDKTMTAILVKLDPTFQQYVRLDGTSVVQLDKALYGTVEAARLWYDNITRTLQAYGFVQNPYDRCVFNRSGTDGKQLTVVFHVDDLLVTSEYAGDLDEFEAYMKRTYNIITSKRGPKIDYLAMTMDFTRRSHGLHGRQDSTDGY